MGVVQQEGVPSASDMQAAASEMNAFYSRLATDKAYAAQLLAAIQKNDRAGITTLLKAAMSKTTITLGKVNPHFHVDMSLSIGHYKWSLSVRAITAAMATTSRWDEATRQHPKFLTSWFVVQHAATRHCQIGYVRLERNVDHPRAHSRLGLFQVRAPGVEVFDAELGRGKPPQIYPIRS